MARFIVKLEHEGVEAYMEWSTIADAPGTYLMELDEFLEYYRLTYGTNGVAELPARLERADRTGTSSRGPDSTAAHVLECNRAGPNEAELTEAEIWQQFYVDRPEAEE